MIAEGLDKDHNKTAINIASHGEVLINFAGHGMWHEAVLKGAAFWASTQAAVAATVGLGTSATGIILTNPVGSGKYIFVQKALGAPANLPAGAAPTGLAVQLFHATAVVQGTPLIVRPSLISGSGETGVGLAASAATLPQAPVFAWPFFGSQGAAGGTSIAGYFADISGQIILAPGTSISTFSLTTAASALWAIYWTEASIGALTA